ncbi:MAG: hypothetical protein NWE98_01210 [Candidatus Bathyarchaeota archaeon]|nr:hypothetical protein [Candidatus Bathyarchaeota archaeon]
MKSESIAISLAIIIAILLSALLISFLWYIVNDQNRIIQIFGNPVTGPTPTPFTPETPQPPLNPIPTPAWRPTIGTTNPSVPEFTVRYVDHSYDVPPTYKIDPYTGKTVVDRNGYHVDNRTIEVTIKNQAFTPSVTEDGNITGLYYNVRSKGHYEGWNDASSYHYIDKFQASTSSQTVILFFLQNWSIPPGGQVDFQVQAVIGYSYTYVTGLCGESTARTFVSISQSDWSSTQTITIDSSSSLAS